MSEAAPTAAGAPPAAAPSPAPAPAPQVAPPAPPTPVPAPEADPNWLKGRLERERNKAIKDLGFESPEAAKAAAEALQKQAEAQKSAEQRALEATQAAAAEKARADAAVATATEFSARMMVGLTAEQQSAVKAIAGDDPVKQLATINALAPTWAKDAPKPGAPPAPPLPSTTAPAAGAPSGTTPPVADPRALYEETRKTNPFAAAAFGRDNPNVYSPK